MDRPVSDKWQREGQQVWLLFSLPSTPFVHFRLLGVSCRIDYQCPWLPAFNSLSFPLCCSCTGPSVKHTHGIAVHLFFCWLQPDESCYLRRRAKDVALNREYHSVLHSPAWKDLPWCFYFVFKIALDTLCSATVQCGYFNCPLNHNAAGEAGKDTCQSLRWFTLGEVLLCYLTYTSMQVYTHTPRYLNSRWHWLTFTHPCLHTQSFSPSFVFLLALSNIHSRTHSHYVSVCDAHREQKRWEMSQIMSDRRQHLSNASMVQGVQGQGGGFMTAGEHK